MRVISGACCGAMPSSPISPVTTTIRTEPLNSSFSALTMSQRMLVMSAPGSGGGAQFLGFLDGFVDAADHVEGLFRQVVAFAVADHLEAADGFLQADVLARRAGEHFRHVERLGEE